MKGENIGQLKNMLKRIKNKKYHQLTEQEQTEIYLMFISGKYYMYEISKKYRVSSATIWRVYEDRRNTL